MKSTIKNIKRCIEELIEVAVDCPVKRSEIPPDIGYKKTIARIGYEVLIANPYKFSEREFFKEVHEVRRRRTDLKLDSYNIKRSALVKILGWGIHRDKNGKLALIPMESADYKKLQETIKRTKSYRINKA